MDLTHVRSRTYGALSDNRVLFLPEFGEPVAAIDPIEAGQNVRMALETAQPALAVRKVQGMRGARVTIEATAIQLTSIEG
jgi:hypothetical protein